MCVIVEQFCGAENLCGVIAPQQDVAIFWNSEMCLLKATVDTTNSAQDGCEFLLFEMSGLTVLVSGFCMSSN